MLARASLVFIALAGFAAAAELTVVNSCSESIDPAFNPQVDVSTGGVGASTIGGFVLAPGASQSVGVPSGYSGFFWGRTGCDSDGSCTTGTCPGGVNCTSSGDVGVTTAEFVINPSDGLDFFRPFLNEGFNLPITITPGAGCDIAPVSCTDSSGDGNGCGATTICSTGTDYTLTFC